MSKCLGSEHYVLPSDAFHRIFKFVDTVLLQTTSQSYKRHRLPDYISLFLFEFQNLCMLCDNSAE